MHKPLGDKILITAIPQDDEKTKSGLLYVPDQAREKPCRGNVVACGQGRYNDAGVLIPMEVKVGDVVMYSKFGGNVFQSKDDKGEDVEYLILGSDDLFVVVDPATLAKKKE